MRAGDIALYKTILCTMDATLPCPNVTEIKLDEEDALYGYIAKLCAAALSDPGAKTAAYEAEDYAASFVPVEPEGMEAFAKETAQQIYELVAGNAVMKSGSGIFAFFMAEDQPYVAMFKMPFQEMFQCRLDASGNVSWVLGTKLMPKGGLKQCEYFAVDVLNRVVRVADIEHYIDDCKINYLADLVLRLKAKPSEKKTVEIMRDAAVEVIRECYPKEQVPEKILDYKQEMAQRVEQTGSVSVAAVEQKVFADNEQAGGAYRERMERERVQREPIPVSPRTERALMRKAKIVADNGIEILVPVEYLKDPDHVEYVQGEDGRITILLKDIHSLDL